MNKQEIFDAVVVHARKQGKKSEVAGLGTKINPVGLYRSPNGLRCFMGALIEDDEYRSQWERMNIMMVLSDYRCPKTLISRMDPLNNRSLLYDLQILHDSTRVAEWEQGFQRIASRHELEYKAP